MYSQPCTLAQLQAREADIRALTELTRALDKKVLLNGALFQVDLVVIWLFHFSKVHR